MKKKNITTTSAPAAIGPYSQGIFAESFAFISGQLPIDPLTGKFAGEDIKSQTKQSILNIQEILKANGMSLDNIVKTTVYLADITEFSDMNEVYAEYFKEPYPARAAFQVAALPQNAKVEIEVIASL